MSRIVRSPSRLAAVASPSSSPPPDDDYASRTAKYIPGEVVAAYLAILKVLETVGPDAPGASAVTTVSWAAFIACLAAVPGYLRLVAKPDEPWKFQGWISMGAFAVWAYALGGPFQRVGIYIPFIGSILLILYTLLAGLVRPK